MKLYKLLDQIQSGVAVWISDDPLNSEAIYFGNVEEIPARISFEYEVAEIYPERYPAMFCIGISIIVKKSK